VSVAVQLGLFGGCAEVAGMHVVSAHTRVKPDGNEVFVSEHLRWSLGRRAPLRGARALPAPRAGAAMPEVELFPGAFQLPLWRG
jgi:hypothetical protein